MNSRHLALLRALGWSLTIGMAAAYLFYFSAAWFAGGRFDAFIHPRMKDVSDENCQCQPATRAMKAGLAARVNRIADTTGALS